MKYFRLSILVLPSFFTVVEFTLITGISTFFKKYQEVKTAAMLVEMGEDNPLKPIDYLSIQHSTLLMLGDRDKMVTLDETLEVYKNLPNAQLAVLPNTPHPIEMINTGRIVNELKVFLL